MPNEPPASHRALRERRHAQRGPGRSSRINQQTLRYYERRGLLAQPQRSPGGRLYPAVTLTLPRVIKTAQRLGFTLDEVAELVDPGTHRHSRRPNASLQQQARAELAEIEAKIADLQIIATSLRAAIDDLATCATTSCCPLPFADLDRGGQP